MNAERCLVAEVYLKLLKTADAAILDGFVKLVIKELSAAQGISGEVCAKLLDAQLDMTDMLPPEIVAQDEQFLLLALASPPRTALTLPDPAQVDQAMQAAVVNLPQ